MNSEETLSGEEDIDGEGVAPDMDQGEASDQEDGEEESMGLQHRSYVEPNDEVVVKIEGVGDSTDGSVLVQTKSDEASNMTVEVSPSRPKSSEVLAAFEATASDEVIRNIDVVMKLRKLTQVRVADWILRHKCCPKEYQEKIGTPEGYRNGGRLVIPAMIKLRKEHGKNVKNTNFEKVLKFRLAPFVFPPWKEPFQGAGGRQHEISIQKKKMREEEEERKRNLRLELIAKEDQLKQLKTERELAPSKAFIEICGITKKRKERAEEELKEVEKEWKKVAKEEAYWAEKLPEARKHKKKMHDNMMYRTQRLQSLADLGPKVKAVARKNAAAKELLEYEKAQVKLLKADHATLQEEASELEPKFEELKDEAFYDAMVGAGGASADDSELNRPIRMKEYNPEMVKVIKELYEIGIDVESIQSVFESVFGSINFTLQRFPSVGVIYTICTGRKSHR